MKVEMSGRVVGFHVESKEVILEMDQPLRQIRIGERVDLIIGEEEEW